MSSASPRCALIGAVAGLALAALPAAAAPLYEVTIANATRGQLITPPVVATHDESFRLFQVGQAVGPELAALAQDGVTDPLVALLEAHAGVLSIAVASEGIPAGGSATFEVAVDGSHRLLSLAGMLATTNDAFIALASVPLPRSGEVTRVAFAYDAGAEGNSESCAHIPGPPCGFAGVPNDEGKEGFAHIHAGVHGIADLDPAGLDWRNPAAEVTIRRVE